jgi:hypothetical protein
MILKRLNDEQVEDRCLELIICFIKGTDPHLKVSKLIYKKKKNIFLSKIQFVYCHILLNLFQIITSVKV